MCKDIKGLKDVDSKKVLRDDESPNTNILLILETLFYIINSLNSSLDINQNLEIVA